MYHVVMPAYLFITCTLRVYYKSSVCQLPICDLFTQHVISLWRDTTSELWTPVLFSLLLNQPQPNLCLLACNLLFLQFTFLQQFSIHMIHLTLCVQQNR